MRLRVRFLVRSFVLGTINGESLTNHARIGHATGVSLRYENDTFFDTCIRAVDGIRKQRMQFMRP